MKKLVCLLTAFAMLLCLGACAAKEETAGQASAAGLSLGKPAGEKLLTVRLTVTYGEDTVSEDGKFGAAFLSMSQEEFEALGFTLGDACTVEFGNGYRLADVPYYNGYYVRNGAPVIVAYPGDPFVRITHNNEGIWSKAGLKDGDSVVITLTGEGKYLDVQEALGQSYSFDRGDYPGDEAFANFRALSGGKLKADFLFRGASPVDNSRGRAAYADALLEENGVRFVIDLADSEEDMRGYIASPDFASGYVEGLYEAGADVLLDMGSGYTGGAYHEKVVQGLRAMLGAGGPVYIHCMEGKDRTGFVCLLLEALAGAGYDELLRDYMATYENYFSVTKDGTPGKYAAIEDLYFVPFLAYLHGTEDLDVLKSADFTADAAAYLQEGGMTEAETEALTAMITE